MYKPVFNDNKRSPSLFQTTPLVPCMVGARKIWCLI